MSAHRERPNKFEKLRQQAEALIQQRPDIKPPPSTDILDLIQELKIYQAELEIQNEELQRAQQEISQLHQEYENLYEFAPCGYLTLDNKGLITHINLTGSTLLGTARKFIPRIGFSQFIDLDREDAFLSARARSAETGEKQSIELPIKRENGNSLWVRADIEADRDKSGAVNQWRLVLIDITLKKETEVALQQSESKFRKMMESMTDAVYCCSNTLAVDYMNPAMIKRIGRDATGEPCYKAIHGLDQPCEWCQIEDIRNGQVKKLTIKSPLDNRTYRITSVPVVGDDHSISKLTIYRDITEFLKTIEEKDKIKKQLFQSQKLESIGTLAGGIAHDFNNILSSVIGFTELALDDAEKGSSIEDSLQEIYTGGKRARDLVKQILAFARQSEDAMKPVQIDTIAKEVLKLLRASIPASIRIEQNIKKNLQIMGNATQVDQVLLNLCTNAAQAMEDDGGTLEVSINDTVIDKNDILTDLKAGEYVEIKISDTGTGIDPDIMDKIFDPYFSTKATGKGTGMGLSLVHGIVKRYNGTITVDSSPGQGTVFTVYLPLIRSGRISDLHQPEILPTGDERILLVDDEAPIVKMTSQILQKLGYQVVFRTSSVKALELFRSNPDDFDLVITDMTMPDMTGVKLAAELMSIRRDIPVILCTGYSNKISDKTAADFGIKAFAYKPVSMADLAKTVRKVLDEAKGKIQQ